MEASLFIYLFMKMKSLVSRRCVGVKFKRTWPNGQERMEMNDDAFLIE